MTGNRTLNSLPVSVGMLRDVIFITIYDNGIQINVLSFSIFETCTECPVRLYVSLAMLLA